MRSLALNRGNILAIFQFDGKRPASMVLLMIEAKEADIIGAPSFRSLQGILSRPVALLGDNNLRSLKTSSAVV